VIQGFTVKINPAKVGLPISAIIEFQPRASNDAEGIAAVCRHPSVFACFRVTGPSLLVLMVRVADNAALTEMLQEFTRFGETQTSVILSTEIDERSIFADSREFAAA
jgi:Lrp/AsnC family leucine-responsive transcriptional regulator